ncbi:MAG: UDP-glucose 4-epimerase GalE [Ignavibacteria bacterium]|jgi:UDP-glucose 4-epimerase
MILVTGGAGYIGSHFVREALKSKRELVVFDNLSRGNKESISKNVPFENVDIQDFTLLKSAVAKYDIKSVVHFAAFAYVGESVQKPDLYYRNNVAGSLNLIRAAVEMKIENFVFSSTCSLYGNPEKIPIDENTQPDLINPYAKSKFMVENILKDMSKAYGIKYASLRYFNAAGDDSEGEIGESHDPETHLIPIVVETALGKREKVLVFGDDYNTHDGTCIRDYIHVNDLADAHIKALDYIADNDSIIVNLGTGNGNSILEVIKKAEEVSGCKVNYEISKRREGDPAILVADNKKAFETLGWQPKYSLDKIIESAYKWHKNPKY